MFLDRKEELVKTPQFADMLAVFMFTLDKQKILWFEEVRREDDGDGMSISNNSSIASNTSVSAHLN